MFTLIKLWWDRNYPKIDKWCDDHTKTLLAIGAVLFLMALIGAVCTYHNLKLNRDYVRRLDEAQGIVKEQRDIIQDLNKSLESQVARVEELLQNNSQEQQISQGISDIISTTIVASKESLESLENSQKRYDDLVAEKLNKLKEGKNDQ